MSRAAEKPHFHIRWSGNDALDWERFDSREIVEERAKALVRPGESFTIEEQSENCPVCFSNKDP